MPFEANFSGKNTPRESRPVGVFDSGIGGLTVMKELMRLLPHEQILYFGDTARIPYGTKSEETVRRFALEDSFFLLEKEVKMIVVACNTASAIAVPFLREILPVPVIGVIQPGAAAAARYSKSGKVGVIGTAATIRSGSYNREMLKVRPEMQILTRACPLLVPLVEEGMVEDEATYLIARRYLQPIMENNPDTLILGCTHYPLLKGLLQRIVGPDVRLVDSGVEAAREVKRILAEKNMAVPAARKPRHQLFVSDLPDKFQEISERFLERSLPYLQTVDFERFLMRKGAKFWEKFQGKLKEYLQEPLPDYPALR